MVDTLPTVSIALASWNGGRFLEAQLDSIAASTFREIEIVACDDASEDESEAILERYSAILPIRVYRNEERLGYVKNFEKAIGLCRGRYIALCDQDDIWHPDKLAKCVAAISAAEGGEDGVPVMVHSDSRLINAAGEVITASYQSFRGYDFRAGKQYGTMLCRSGVMGHTMLMNRKLLEIALPFPEQTVHHDAWLALVNEWFGKRISLKEALVDYRVHDANSGGKGKQRNRMPWQLPCHGETRYRLLRTAKGRYRLPEGARRSFLLAARYARRQKGLLRFYPAMALEGFFPKGIWGHLKRIVRIAAVEWRMD